MTKYANGVFEGGGVKSIGLVGAAEIVEAKGYTWHSVAGSSGGAIVAAFLAAGYRSEDIYHLLQETSFRNFLKGNSFITKVPYIGPGLRFVTKNGLYTGDPIENWIRSKLTAKGVKRYRDLKSQLKVTVSDITLGRMVVIPDDLPHYGFDPELFDVALSVRMSISLPFFFEPVFLAYGDNKDQTSCMMDGGMLSNFPVWIFDQDMKLEWPTFGFRLVSDVNSEPHRTNTSFDILKAIVGTLLEAHDTRFIAEHNFVRTIMVPTMGIKTTEFSISQEKFHELHQAGKDAAIKFFKKWNYDNYLLTYQDAIRNNS